ncbi:MAG: hypothetical protein HPZ79_05865 [Oscillospiraceae bacterium]|nr:hypothetical protein [Oscillospiraceae bacterium]
MKKIANLRRQCCPSGRRCPYYWVGYSLSDGGKSLMKILNALCVWGEENRR